MCSLNFLVKNLQQYLGVVSFNMIMDFTVEAIEI